jgi:hypothetical protein
MQDVCQEGQVRVLDDTPPRHPVAHLLGVPVYTNPNLPINVRTKDGTEFALVGWMIGKSGQMIFLTGPKVRSGDDTVGAEQARR